jgi:hypothetical protein
MRASPYLLAVAVAGTFLLHGARARADDPEDQPRAERLRLSTPRSGDFHFSTYFRAYYYHLTNPGAVPSADGQSPAQSGVAFSSDLILPNLSYAFTERLHVSFTRLSLAYRFGDPKGIEVIPAIGAPVLGGGHTRTEGAMLNVLPGVSVDLRAHFSETSVLGVSGGLRSYVLYREKTEGSVFRDFYGWIQLGLVESYGDSLTLAPSFTLGIPSYSEGTDAILSFGQTMSKGVWEDPLLRLHLSHHIAFDVFGSAGVSLTRSETYSAGGGLGLSAIW